MDERQRLLSDLGKSRVAQERQYHALSELIDEVGGMLSAQQLRGETVDTETVRRWLDRLYQTVLQGLGK